MIKYTYLTSVFPKVMLSMKTLRTSLFYFQGSLYGKRPLATLSRNVLQNIEAWFSDLISVLSVAHDTPLLDSG